MSSLRPYDFPRSDHFRRPMGGLASRADFRCQYLVMLEPRIRLTLLKSILQLIRPDWLPILPGITPRTGTVLCVLLGLEVAPTSSLSYYIGPDRMKPALLTGLQSRGHGLMVHAVGGHMVRGSRMGILVSQLLEMVVSCDGLGVCEGIRI